MSATIIYPVAFQRSGVDHTPAIAQSAGRATTDVLTDMQRASQASARHLDGATREIALMRRQEDQLARHADDITQTSQTLGAQMQRLIEETRRMVSYLRADH